MGNNKLKFFLIILIMATALITGCATAPTLLPQAPEGIPGIFHKVDRGQTLWMISKMYDVDLGELVRINRISDATKIETGQLIFIPYRQKIQHSYNSGYHEDFIWPLKGKTITFFGQTFQNMVNKGINIQPYGSLDVVAARKGKVVFYSPDFKGFGKTIIIDHGDGFSTVYARNSKVFVKIGEYVEQGVTIAKAGETQNISSAAYLHFEIRKEHIPENPYFYLP